MGAIVPEPTAPVFNAQPMPKTAVRVVTCCEVLSSSDREAATLR